MFESLNPGRVNNIKTVSASSVVKGAPAKMQMLIFVDILSAYFSPITNGLEWSYSF